MSEMARLEAWKVVALNSDLVDAPMREMVDAIEKSLDAAVSDMQARLDEERKAHAETRKELERVLDDYLDLHDKHVVARKLAEMVIATRCCEGADAKWTAEAKAAIVDYKAALAASGARKGDE